MPRTVANFQLVWNFNFSKDLQWKISKQTTASRLNCHVHRLQLTSGLAWRNVVFTLSHWEPTQSMFSVCQAQDGHQGPSFPFACPSQAAGILSPAPAISIFRCLYWEARSLSRLRGHTVTVIGDGMDQAKWEIPRSSIMRGKEFSTFQKARCHVACLHAHGRCCLYFVSAPDTKKDGNASTEMLSFLLTKLQQQGLHLPSTHLVLQHDNTCREFKNHNGLRWCVSQVSAQNLASVTCQFLRTGHTHEDVDQSFGRLGRFMQRFRDIQTPSEIADVIRKYLETAKLPFENERIVVEMHRVRDWFTGLFKDFFYVCAIHAYRFLPRVGFEFPFLVQSLAQVWLSCGLPSFFAERNWWTRGTTLLQFPSPSWYRLGLWSKKPFWTISAPFQLGLAIDANNTVIQGHIDTVISPHLLSGLSSAEIEQSPWNYPEHPSDVIMRTATCIGTCHDCGGWLSIDTISAQSFLLSDFG